ncbi:MAG: polysaccharide deacetylase family protein [Thermodesulfobacteriota bacterium]
MSSASILMYHSIDGSGSVISTSPEKFAGQMRVLARSKAVVMGLADMAGSIRDGSPLPSGSVAVTFDDGFRNFYTTALPVLKDLGLKATVFVVTGRMGGDNRWEGQPDAVPTLDLMDWDEVATVAEAGIDIGVHTVSHPDLTRVPPDRLTDEVAGASEEIEKRTGLAPSAFAYPYGGYDAAVRELVAGQFECACSTELGLAGPTSDPWALPRVEMYYFSRNNLFKWLGTPVFSNYIRARGALRTMRTGVL